MTDMDGGGFLAQGGYGCVFYPEVNCQIPNLECG